jgi:hypothetical protein
MSVEEFVQAVEKATTRTTLLKRAGLATLGVVTTLLGFPHPARATYGYKCCNLCHSPTSCSGCDCSWCWRCCYSVGQWRCCECYQAGGDCDRYCDGVTCSSATYLGKCPAPLMGPA